MLGGPPPWAAVASERRQPTLDQLLGLIDPARPPAHDLTPVDGRAPSAVLAPLYEGPGGPTFILTRRAWHLRSHTGEVSFPGGRKDDDDPDLVTTALRETEEEIGLDPSLVTIVGELPRLSTVSSPAAIVPYVGLLDGPPPDLRPSPDEVDAVLHVTVAELLRPDIYREELWSRGGATLEVTFFELVGDTLWGATARMLRSLFERL